MNNKKIASEFAIGIILLIAVVIGGIFWIQNKNTQVLDDAGMMVTQQPIKKIQDLKKNNNQVEGEQSSLTEEEVKASCRGRLFEGEAELRGSYVLETIPGTTKREWLLKIAEEDIDKLPVQAKTESNEVVRNLLFLSDATPEMIAKLKKATEDKPETVTIKGFYLDCEGVPVVSIEPAKLALAKYLKK